MHEEEYTFKADIWSLGVLMYISLSGVMPFNGKTKEDLKKQVTFGRFDFEPRPFNKVSQEAKELIMQMLQVNPQLRP